MKNLKKLFVFGLIVSMLVVSFAGCTKKADKSDKGTETSKPAESTKDTGSTDNSEADDNSKFTGKLKVQLIGSYAMEDKTDLTTGKKQLGLRVMKEEFEKLYPNAELEFVIMGWDNYVQKTQAMITSNECDVYQVPAIASLAAQDLLVPLAPYIERDKFDLNQYIDGQIDGWKAMGTKDTELEIYGLPFLGDTRVIVYDKQIFDEWGVEYLSENPTPEEIMEKAKKMTGKNPVTGEANYGITFRSADGADTTVNLAESYGGTWGSGFKWTEMETNFDSQEMIEGVTYLKELAKYAPEGILAGQGAEKWNKPGNNIAINLREGPQYPKRAEAVGIYDRMQGALLFVNPDTQTGGMFAGSPFAIGNSSSNKDLAWEFMKFTASDFVQKYTYNELNNVPITKAAYEWEEIVAEPQMKIILDSMARLWTPRYPYRASQPRYILSENVEKALLGDLTPEEAMKKAQADTKAWLEQQVD